MGKKALSLSLSLSLNHKVEKWSLFRYHLRLSLGLQYDYNMIRSGSRDLHASKNITDGYVSDVYATHLDLNDNCQTIEMNNGGTYLIHKSG